MVKLRIYLENEIHLATKSKDPRFQDLDGMVFGKLTVIGFAGRFKNYCWWVRCDCGNIVKVQGQGLKIGQTKSCGCLNFEIMSSAITKHGHTKNCHIGGITPTYGTWGKMRQRCQNPNSKDYPEYGGRGITVCERWLKFVNFLEDMGEKPKGLSLDRKDNSKGYYKENCRWATPKEQANNTRRNRFIEFNSKKLTLSQWADETGINQDVISSRLIRGWNIERTLTTQVIKR